MAEALARVKRLANVPNQASPTKQASLDVLSQALVADTLADAPRETPSSRSTPVAASQSIADPHRKKRGAFSYLALGFVLASAAATVGIFARRGHLPIQSDPPAAPDPAPPRTQPAPDKTPPTAATEPSPAIAAMQPPAREPSIPRAAKQELGEAGRESTRQATSAHAATEQAFDRAASALSSQGKTSQHTSERLPLFAGTGRGKESRAASKSSPPSRITRKPYWYGCTRAKAA